MELVSSALSPPFFTIITPRHTTPTTSILSAVIGFGFLAWLTRENKPRVVPGDFGERRNELGLHKRAILILGVSVPTDTQFLGHFYLVIASGGSGTPYPSAKRFCVFCEAFDHTVIVTSRDNMSRDTLSLTFGTGCPMLTIWRGRFQN